MRYRIFRKKTYIMYEQAPISEADSNALAARNCEGTEQLRVTFNSQLGIYDIVDFRTCFLSFGTLLGNILSACGKAG